MRVIYHAAHHLPEFYRICMAAYTFSHITDWNYRIGYFIMHEFLHQMRSDKHAIIGYRVIHGKSVYGRNRHAISIGHARQLDSVFVIMLPKYHSWRYLSGYAHMQQIEKSQFGKPVLESSRLITILACYNFCNTDV